MNSPDLKENPSVQRIEALKAIQPDTFELWKYYEDRADHLGERMWTEVRALASASMSA